MTRRPAAVVLLAVAALCCLSRPTLARSGAEHPRSIDLGSGSNENGLEPPKATVHPHEADDKPTKFDLDVSQYTETDDEELIEIERRGSSTTAKVIFFGVVSWFYGVRNIRKKTVDESLTNFTLVISLKKFSKNFNTKNILKFNSSTYTIF